MHLPTSWYPFQKSLWCSQRVYVANVIVVIAKKKGGKNCRRGQVALMQCKNKWGILILKGIGSPDVHCTMFFADLCEIRNTLNVIFNFSQYQKLQLNFFAPWHKKAIFNNSHNLWRSNQSDLSPALDLSFDLDLRQSGCLSASFSATPPNSLYNISKLYWDKVARLL